MNIRQRLLRVAAAWVALLLFMALLKPQSLPVIVLIIPFVLLFAALFTLWDLVLVLWVRYVAHNATGNLHRHLGVMISMGVVLVLVLQSLGQLTLRDVITLMAVMTLGYIYAARNRFSVSRH